MRLCIEIQNAGIGTAFFRWDAHCNHADIAIHCPIWAAKTQPTHSLRVWGASEQYLCEDSVTHNEKVLSSLRTIMATGERVPVEEARVIIEKAQAAAEYEKAQARYNELFKAEKTAA